jgi:two-component sensor histidine kinase
LPEAESIPIALSLNELLTNAIKHSGEGAIACHLACDENQVLVRIANPGRLPEGFSLTQLRPGVSGLGLVRSLLPRRSARFDITQQGATVVCSVTLNPPGVTLTGTIASQASD